MKKYENTAAISSEDEESDSEDTERASMSKSVSVKQPAKKPVGKK